MTVVMIAVASWLVLMPALVIAWTVATGPGVRREVRSTQRTPPGPPVVSVLLP